MSYTVSSQDPSWEIPAEQSASRSSRLLRVIAGAVLFVLGIIAGGMMGQPRVPVQPIHPPVDLAALRAEISQLNHQVMQAQSRTLELEQQLAHQPPSMTLSAEPPQGDKERALLLGRAIELLNANRQVCLDELQQFQRSSIDVPTDQVIRFAQSQFDNQCKLLRGLASNESLTATLLDLQSTSTLPSVAAPARNVRAGGAVRSRTPAGHVSMITAKQTQSGSVAHRSEREPTLAEPTLAEPTLAVDSSRRGVYFTAPQPRRQGVTFYTPQLPSRVASRPRSGMVFTDASAFEAEGTLR